MAQQAKGQGNVFRRGGIWHIRYWDGRTQLRESARTKDRKEALDLLQQKLALVSKNGVGAHQATINALLNLLIKDYREQDRASLQNVEQRVNKHVRPAFGKLQAKKLTTTHIREYKERRLASGAANATVNRELAWLRRAFNLGALEDPPLVTRVPRIVALKEDNAREGFLEEPKYRELLNALEDSVKPVFVMLYHLGMRTGELLKVKRDWVDLVEGVIYVNGRVTKNKKPKTVPIFGDMGSWLEMQLARCQALSPKAKELFVWEDGKPIRDFRGSWQTACDSIGLPDLIPHDLRRTAVRNMIRAGVPEKVAMEISGHKTAAMLWRYNIVDTRDIVEAGRKTDRYLKNLRWVDEQLPKETKQ
jgi:integrase